MSRMQTNGKSEGATTADLNAQIETLRGEIGALAETLASVGAAKVQETKSTAKVAVEDAAAYASLHAEELRKRGAEAADFTAAKAQDAQAQVFDFMKNQPATAIGIAAGAGFLIGMMSKRR